MKEDKQITQLFKISHVGLDTSHLNYCPTDELLEEFDFIYTSIGNNNDHTISEFIDPSEGDNTTYTYSMSKKSLVTEIKFTDKIVQGILSHLSAIGREWIDILEIPASCNWTEDTVEQIKVLMDSGIVCDISIKDPDSLERIMEIKALLEQKEIQLYYVSLKICPLNFDYKIITWCTDNLIKIIGYNPMGGYISGPSLVESFSAPYLLGFAATYCHVVFLSSRDMLKSIQDAKYLRNLEGEYTKPMYILKKEVHKLIKPLKKVIWTSAILENTVHLDYNSSDYVPTGGNSIMMNLGKPYEYVDDKNYVSTELEKEVFDFLGQLTYPQDASQEDKFYIAKNQIITFLKTKYPLYTFMYSQINKTTVAIKAEHETVSGWWIFKSKEVDKKQFIISMRSSGLVYFKENRN